GRFVGSDILYEDLRERRVDKDHHRILRKEKLNKMDTIVLESIPVEPENSVYDKKIIWVHPKTLLALKVELYQDGSKEPVKRVLAKKVEKKQGIWTIMKSVSRNLITQHETHLLINKIKYDQNVPKDLFSKKYLEDPQREKDIIKQLSGK
ncbi:MAG: outer membrane lipoprotein-sorting protein, partial [Gammaproteobacteria bacterium]|nr:outer membrane lipoprotein-sorting protein [Gammaproteobacteria bacterium]